MSSINLENLSKRYGTHNTIPGIDLAIEAGEFVVLVGPSGCGKSTLLRMIAGLEKCSGGAIFIGGRRVNALDASQRGIAMVFQSYALYPHMSVRENIGFGLKMLRRSKSEINAKIEEVSETLHLEALLDRRPKELSGGQRQRVAIGRAIVRDPEVFLFDEPLSNLDAELRVKMRLEMAQLHKQLGTTMVYVTHDQIEAMTLADKIAVMRAGKIEQFGTPMELFSDPANVFVAGFIGAPKMNFVMGRVENTDGDTVTVRAQGGALLNCPIFSSCEEGMEILLGLRPQKISLGDGAAQSMIATYVEALGTETNVFGSWQRVDGFTITVSSDLPVDVGNAVHFSIKPQDVFAFDPASGNRFK